MRKTVLLLALLLVFATSAAVYGECVQSITHSHAHAQPAGPSIHCPNFFFISQALPSSERNLVANTPAYNRSFGNETQTRFDRYHHPITYRLANDRDLYRFKNVYRL